MNTPSVPAPSPKSVGADRCRLSPEHTLMELVERHGPLSRSRAATLFPMSESTLRRASAVLLRGGLLTLRYSEDSPLKGKEDLLDFARFGPIEMLEVTPTRLHWRMAHPRELLHTLTRERNPFLPLEEDLLLLMSQTASFVRQGEPRSPLLMLPLGETDGETAQAVRRALHPAAIMTPEEAAALELSYAPATADYGDLLLIHDGEEPVASLLHRRSTEERFMTLPYTQSLTQALRAAIRHTPADTPDRAEAIASYPAELCRYLRPACVVTELPASAAHTPKTSLPPDVPRLTFTYSYATPSLSHKGALRLGRQILWKSRLNELSADRRSRTF